MMRSISSCARMKFSESSGQPRKQNRPENNGRSLTAREGADKTISGGLKKNGSKDGSSGGEIAPRNFGWREQARRRSESNARPERPQRSTRQEIWLTDDHQKRPDRGE